MAFTSERPPCQTDQELLARARLGDAEAFCSIASAHESRLLRQSFRLCGNQTTAEDLAVETLHEAWKSLARFNGKCRLETWLFSILLHRYQKHVRRARSRPVACSCIPPASPGLETAPFQIEDSALLPSQELILKETSREVRDALASIPEKHRTVLLLRFMDDASLPEISAALGCPIGTVKSRLHYGLEELRKLLAVRHAEPFE